MWFYSIIVSILTVFASLFVPFANAPVPETEDDGFVPVMRFVSTSDTHIKVLGDEPCRRVAKMIKTAYAISENDKDYKELDAVVFSGDITDDGAFTSFSAFTATTDKLIREGTERLGLVAKSHDSGMYGSKALGLYTSLTGQESDFHRVINGFHFIGISRSAEEEQHYSVSQTEWLEEELQKAVSEAPLQPVFVFQHEHVKNTVYGSGDIDGWGMDNFTEVLDKYPQVIHISGHSHYPANDPRSIWQGGFTAINDGGLAYFEFTVDGQNRVHPENYKTMTQALVVEVDACNRVLVRVLDVDAGMFVAEYLIDNVSSPVKLKYNHQYRSAMVSAPYFEEGVQLKTQVKGDKIRVIIPQAKTEEGNEVFLYRIKAEDENGNIIYEGYKLSEYYFADTPDYIESDSFSLTRNSCTVSVYAEDVWGNAGEVLSVNVNR